MVKFLASLIQHSMQPARRVDVSMQQAEPLTLMNPMQESLQQDASATAAPLAQPRRMESKTGFTTERSGSQPEESTSRRMDETPIASDESPLPNRLGAQPLSLDRPAVHATSAKAEDARSKTPDAQNEREDAPAVDAKPSFPVAQTEIETRRVSAQNRVAGEPNELKSGSSQTSSLSGEAEAVLPLPVVESGVSKAAEQNSAADPAQDENGASKSLQAHPLPKSASEMDLPANKPQSQQAQEPVKRIQPSVQQEQSLLHNRFPAKPVQQSQPREIPQVRIGQINVLVEDQAPAKPKPRKSSTRPAASNPFGIRGL